MKIPRILHQTWKDYDVPSKLMEMAFSWKKMHEDWEYVFWTDEMNRNFIKEHFPFFLPVYDGYAANIQRVDAVRYFVLYKYGGFFIDMDFECLANIDPIIGDSKCIFGKEPTEHCLLHDKSIIISNAFMGTVPEFHFFGQLCRELQQNRNITSHPNNNVLETTGPFMLSRLYQGYEKKEEISLLDAELIYPFTQDELVELNSGLLNNDILQKLKKAYGIHHHAGTWWKK